MSNINIRYRQPEVDANKEVDLMHLAPMFVEETEDWPNAVNISDVRLIRNGNFGEGWKWNEEMRDVSSDYYKFNDHFVWTNQLVVGRGIELDEDENQFSNSFREDVVDIENERIRRNPQSYFALKKTGSFGYGLFARHFVKKGTVIGEYTGELITIEEETRRLNLYKKMNMSNYFYEPRNEGLSIDAGPMGNHTRFINHSCDNVNCEIFLETIEGLPKNWVMAIKNIREGEQLFLNYGKDYFHNLTCLCESDTCLEKYKKKSELDEWMDDFLDSKLGVKKRG